MRCRKSKQDVLEVASQTHCSTDPRPSTVEIYAPSESPVERLEKAVGFLVDPNGPKIERVIHPGSSLIQ